MLLVMLATCADILPPLKPSVMTTKSEGKAKMVAKPFVYTLQLSRTLPLASGFNWKNITCATIFYAMMNVDNISRRE
jgi:hypothetical protein